MNILTAVLLTVLLIVNLFMVCVIAWAIRRCENRNSRIGGMVLLSVLIIDIFSAVWGALL